MKFCGSPIYLVCKRKLIVYTVRKDWQISLNITMGVGRLLLQYYIRIMCLDPTKKRPKSYAGLFSWNSVNCFTCTKWTTSFYWITVKKLAENQLDVSIFSRKDWLGLACAMVTMQSVNKNAKRIWIFMLLLLWNRARH
jgi:hypothetical protein